MIVEERSLLNLDKWFEIGACTLFVIVGVEPALKSNEDTPKAGLQWAVGIFQAQHQAFGKYHSNLMW